LEEGERRRGKEFSPYLPKDVKVPSRFDRKKGKVSKRFGDIEKRGKEGKGKGGKGKELHLYY